MNPIPISHWPLWFYTNHMNMSSPQIAYLSRGCQRMPDNGKEKPTHLNVRYIPRETLHYLKMMAAIERTSVKSLVLGLIEKRMNELERQGYVIRRRP